jgi:hypothetical protein
MKKLFMIGALVAQSIVSSDVFAAITVTNEASTGMKVLNLRGALSADEVRDAVDGANRVKVHIEGPFDLGVGDIFQDVRGQISEVVISDLTNLPTGLFATCTNLSKVTFALAANQHDALPKDFFRECSGLLGVTLPANIRGLGESCFFASGLESITIPARVQDIGASCFGNCTHLGQVTFEAGSLLSKFNIGTFSGCNGLSAIIIPSYVTEMSARSFACENLRSMTFTNKVRVIRIEDNCFGDFDNLDRSSAMAVRFHNALYEIKFFFSSRRTSRSIVDLFRRLVRRRGTL